MIPLLKSEELAEKVQIGPTKLTRFERARIVGARALQISLGAPELLELPPEVSDPIEIALRELEAGALPMTIRRTLPDGSGQDIALVDLLRPRVR